MNRVALVTGSSRGIGRIIAERLAADGFAVAVNGLPGDDGVPAGAAAITAAGWVAGAFPADVTDPGAVAGLVAAVESDLGPLSVVVFNATGPQPNTTLEEAGWPEHLAELDFFVKSPVLIGQAVLAGMRERAYGRLIHIDSEVADRPPPHRSAYVTAKAAQVGLARSWAIELAPHGITVNTVAPGFVPVERHVAVTPETRAAYRATVPADRLGTPADVAHAVSFLASEAAGFITGERIHVNGGRSIAG